MNFILKRETIYCPVCKKEGELGTRYNKDWFIGHCDDCRATYYFPPYKTTPTKVEMDRNKKKGCGCPSCKARDGLA